MKVDAERYFAHSKPQEAYGKAVLESLELDGDERALDIGCADGRLTAALAMRLPEGEITGLDSSPEMIALAQQHYPHLSFVQSDIRNYTSKTPYDLITALLIIQFIEDKKALMLHLRSLLAPGGRLLLTTPVTESSYHNLYTALMTQSKWRPYARKSTVERLSLIEHLTLVKEAGLEVVEVELKTSSWTESPESACQRIQAVLPLLMDLPEALVDPFLEDFAEAVAEATRGQSLSQKVLTLLLRQA